MFDLIGKIYVAGTIMFFVIFGIHWLKKEPRPTTISEFALIFGIAAIVGMFWPVIVGGWIL